MSAWEGFYSTAQVSRLARIPRRTLYDWDRRGIVKPSVYIMDHDKIVDKGYSYSDLAIIKLLRALKVKQLSLQSVVKSLRHLYQRFGPPTSPGWVAAYIYVDGKEVYTQRPDAWDTTLAAKDGQRVEMKILGEMFEEDEAVLVPNKYDAYVEIDLNVMEGQPVIRDTRVPTSILATMFEQGTPISELARLYKPIPKEAIEKAIEFERILDTPITTIPA